MKTKNKQMPKPDRYGFFVKKDALAVIKNMGVEFSEQSVEQALRENWKDPSMGIPHRRSDPIKSHAKIYLRIEDVLAWLQKSNTTTVDLTKAK